MTVIVGGGTETLITVIVYSPNLFLWSVTLTVNTLFVVGSPEVGNRVFGIVNVRPSTGFAGGDIGVVGISVKPGGPETE